MAEWYRNTLRFQSEETVIILLHAGSLPCFLLFASFTQTGMAGASMLMDVKGIFVEAVQVQDGRADGVG